MDACTTSHDPLPGGHDDPESARAAEPWVTKQQLADHLSVTPRWIEMQQHLGLPRLRMGSIARYSISEVEAWLRERYATPGASRGQ